MCSVCVPGVFWGCFFAGKNKNRFHETHRTVFILGHKNASHTGAATIQGGKPPTQEQQPYISSNHTGGQASHMYVCGGGGKPPTQEQQPYRGASLPGCQQLTGGKPPTQEQQPHRSSNHTGGQASHMYVGTLVASNSLGGGGQASHTGAATIQVMFAVMWC